MADERVTRKLAAILYADVAGYSRLTGQDEVGTHRTLSERLDAFAVFVKRRGGSVGHFAGDAILAEFPSIVDALACAVEVQREFEARDQGFAEDGRVRFRIGINLGEVIADRGEVYGDGVNVAARLQALADPGGICVSGTAYDAVGGRLPLDYEPLGEQDVKNITHPVRAYRVVTTGEVELPEAAQRERTGLALQATVVAGIVIVLVAAVALWWSRPWIPESGQPADEQTPILLPDKPSVAVLPFENLSGDAEQEYFADGITEDIITDLSKLRGLFVIARHTTFAYKGKALDLKQVGRELGVRYVLEGSIRRVEHQVRINTQLIDATTGGHVWAERYDRLYADLFELQDEVIGKIVSALAVTLTDSEQAQLSRRSTDSLEAYDYYLQAEQNLFGYGSERRARALELYGKALALDPEFAEAHAGTAAAAVDVWQYHMSDVMPGAVARRQAFEAASQALELDGNNSRAYAVLSIIQSVDGRHAEAINSARKAISLDPNNANSYISLARALTYAGSAAEALKALETAFRLNPIPPPHFYADLGSVLFWNRRFADAVEPLERARADGVAYLLTLAMTYAQLDRVDDAKAVVAAILESEPFANLAYYEVLYGHQKLAEDRTLRLQSLRKAGVPEWPFDFQGRAEDRLDESEMEGVTFGRTWNGEHADGTPFIQQTSEDGTTAYRGPDALLVGRAWLEGGMLCVQFPSARLGRPSCGYLFRKPEPTGDSPHEYIHVGLGDIFYFSAAQ